MESVKWRVTNYQLSIFHYKLFFFLDFLVFFLLSMGLFLENEQVKGPKINENLLFQNKRSAKKILKKEKIKMEKFENLGLEEMTTDEMMNVDGGFIICTATIILAGKVVGCGIVVGVGAGLIYSGLQN